MGLFKHRPEVSLHAPSSVFAGETYHAEVRVQCPEPLQVNAVALEVSGIVATLRPALTLSDKVTEARCLVEVPLLRGPVDLDAGEHVYRAKVRLPHNAPGSYSGEAINVEWKAKVHVDIPWWPDRRAYFSMHVEGYAVAGPPQPCVFVSDLLGPHGRGPYGEFALASNNIEAGGHIVGHVSLSNVEHNRYRSLRFALVAQEKAPGRASTRIARVEHWSVPLVDIHEGAAIPFELALPAAITPAFAYGGAGLWWELEVEIDVAWGRNPVLRAPLRVRRGAGSDAGKLEAAPLAVGSERIESVWRRAAELTGFDYASECLMKTVDGAQVTIRREYGGWRSGLQMLAELPLEPVDFGLALIFPMKISGYRLSARDGVHADAFWRVGDVLPREYRLVAADDHRIRWAADESGGRVEPLVAFANASERFARALLWTHTHLAAPADVAELETAFSSAARQLRGTFVPAGMDVFGVRDEMPFSLETRWGRNYRLLCTALTVRPLIPIDARHRGTWHGTDRPPATVAGLPALLDGCTGFSIDAQAIEIYFPPRPTDMAATIDRLEGLIAIGLTLSMRDGGYR